MLSKLLLPAILLAILMVAMSGCGSPDPTELDCKAWQSYSYPDGKVVDYLGCEADDHVVQYKCEATYKTGK